MDRYAQRVRQPFQMNIVLSCVSPINRQPLNDLDPQLANGRNVVVHIRISVKQAMAIEKEIRSARQIDQEKEGCSYWQSRKNYRIDKCQHHFRCCSLSHFFLKLLKPDMQKIFRFLSRTPPSKMPGLTERLRALYELDRKEKLWLNKLDLRSRSIN